MNAEEKVARQRLSVPELAEALGNVSEACRNRGMTRTRFSEDKRRFQTRGLAGLKDLPPVHKSHPQTTAPETVERILALSLEHPAWGCCRLGAMLELEGVSVNSPAIQSILARHGMATRYDRLLKLEAKAAAAPIELSAEQAALIERANPAFAERFHRTVLDEFFRVAFRAACSESVEALQADLDAWLAHYNAERPHLGHRNHGKRPLDTVTDYLEEQKPAPKAAA